VAEQVAAAIGGMPAAQDDSEGEAGRAAADDDNGVVFG
jgi:hypothetical protein